MKYHLRTTENKKLILVADNFQQQELFTNAFDTIYGYVVADETGYEIKKLNASDIRKELGELFDINGNLEKTPVEVEFMLQMRHGTEWYNLPNQKSGNDREGIYQRVLVLTDGCVKTEYADSRSIKTRKATNLILSKELFWLHDLKEELGANNEVEASALSSLCTKLTKEGLIMPAEKKGKHIQYIVINPIR